MSAPPGVDTGRLRQTVSLGTTEPSIPEGVSGVGYGSAGGTSSVASPRASGAYAPVVMPANGWGRASGYEHPMPSAGGGYGYGAPAPAPSYSPPPSYATPAWSAPHPSYPAQSYAPPAVATPYSPPATVYAPPVHYAPAAASSYSPPAPVSVPSYHPPVAAPAYHPVYSGPHIAGPSAGGFRH
jgi:hypothetical protein